MRIGFKQLVLGGMTGLMLCSGFAMARSKALPPATELTAEGERLKAKYAGALESLRKGLGQVIPAVDERMSTSLTAAREALLQAEAAVAAAQKDMDTVRNAKGLIDHAKGKWIGGAEKGIAGAKAALSKASNATEREAAEKDLAHWEANKQDGLKALAEREAAYEKAKLRENEFRTALEASQATLSKARAEESAMAQQLLSSVAPVLSSSALDAKLAACMILTVATPHELAGYAQQGSQHAALLERLFASPDMMKEMLMAGGAPEGRYGQALEIYAAILKASPNAREGALQRLALATSLEHAKPIEQSAPADQKNGPAFIDPVKRYLHYEKAFLDGELDPAFKNFTTWEYRLVVNCDAPDEILQWGRTMLRNYRPDHIYNPDYGWRYVSSVRTEVPYGSQNVKYDIPSQHNYQNIIKNGGVCGRRAFFGRFILRSFGIPTWGVTQHKHAALSHWTPKGWVINLGAGFHASYWDKDEVPMSGNQFLLETQARAHGPEYAKVLRAQWISRILGEPAYNDRRKIAGGLWSNIGLYQARELASKAVALGPLGQELAEANDREQKVVSAAVSEADRQITSQNGTLMIPAVAHGKTSGKAAAMKSFSGGMQLHCLGGFKTSYEIEVPNAGTYALIARVATVQDGQKIRFSTDSSPAIETPVPYTVGMWQQTPPVELALAQGKNTIHFELVAGSRGVTVKDFAMRSMR